MSDDNNNNDEGLFAHSYALKTSQQTKDHYRKWASTYDNELLDENGYAQPKRCAEALKAYNIPATIEILDAGCGSGLSGKALLDEGFETIDGCDFSPEMLEVSKKKSVYRSVFEADLNAGQPNIPDEYYDAVVAAGIFSFGHVEPNACDDLVRIIKPGGFLIIGLNEVFWTSSKFQQKITQLETQGILEVRDKQYGDHMPGHEINGWVLSLRKT